jgi:uncharacterized protein (DUF2267 family)
MQGRVQSPEPLLGNWFIRSKGGLGNTYIHEYQEVHQESLSSVNSAWKIACHRLQCLKDRMPPAADVSTCADADLRTVPRAVFHKVLLLSFLDQSPYQYLSLKITWWWNVQIKTASSETVLMENENPQRHSQRARAWEQRMRAHTGNMV